MTDTSYEIFIGTGAIKWYNLFLEVISYLTSLFRLLSLSPSLEYPVLFIAINGTLYIDFRSAFSKLFNILDL